MQRIWFEFNLNGIHAYVVLEWANDMKLHVFANKLKANTYYEHLIHSDIWIFFDNRPMSNLV